MSAPQFDKHLLRMAGRALWLLAAFVVGFVVFMIEAIRFSYDGFPSIVILPIMATIVSGAVVAVAFLLGLFLKISPLKALWARSKLWAAATSLLGFLVLVFGYSLGLRDVGINPDTGMQFEMLDPAAALGGYFLLLFGIANVPISRAPRVGPSPEAERRKVSVP